MKSPDQLIERTTVPSLIRTNLMRVLAATAISVPSGLRATGSRDVNGAEKLAIGYVPNADCRCLPRAMTVRPSGWKVTGTIGLNMNELGLVFAKV